MVIVFTGNGKGKTTAALGQAMRALGRNKKVLMIQFIKGPWLSGEDYFSANFQIPISNFQLRKMGLGFVGILGDKLPRSDHEEAARKALVFFKQEYPKWDMVILDEVNVAVSLNLISAQAVLNAIKDFPEDKLLLMTGRGAPNEFIERADLVTEMKEVKHPYASGEKAKPVVEF